MNQIQEVEKSLKRFLKKKVSFTGAFLVMFLITGGLSYSVNFYTDVVYNKSTDTTKPSREIIIGYKSENTNTGSAGSRLVSYYVPGRPMYEQNNPNPLTEAQIEAAIAAGKPLALHPYDNIRENDAQNNGKASLLFGKTIILGSNSKAGTSITIGDNAKSETSGITIGHSAIGAKNSLVVGAGAYTAQDAGMAIGRTATSLDVAGMSIGVASLSKSEGAMAIGNNATATGKYSIAIGTTEEFKSASTSANTNLVFKYTENTVTASGERAIAIGEKAKAEMKNSVVFGARAIADSSLGAREGGMALGTDSKSTANFATAVGTSAQATGTSSTALGTKAEASGLYSTALGGNTTASGNQSIAIGASDGGLINPNFTKAAGRLSTAIGVNTEVKSTADGSVALGNTTVVNGKDTIALGSKIISQEEKAVVLGYESTDRAATQPTSATIGTAPNTLTYSGFAGNAISVVSVGATGKERQIINVAPGEINRNSTDAINGSQLWATNNVVGNLTKATKDILGGNAKITPNGDDAGKITMTNIGGTGENTIHDAIKSLGWNTKADTTDNAGNVTGSADKKITNNKRVDFAVGKNLTLAQTVDGDGNVKYSYDVKPTIELEKVTVGTPGTPGQNGAPGTQGTPGAVGINGKDGKSADITVAKGVDGVDGTNGADGKTRIVYETKDKNGNPVTEQVATMNDGMKYAGDDGKEQNGTSIDPTKVIKKKLNEQLDIVGGADKTKLSDNNIGVNSKDGKLYVQLSKELKDLTSAEFKNAAGDKTEINPDGITITPAAPAAGTPAKDPVSLTKDGLNNGGNTITNVAPGVNGTDAVNKNQLDNAGWNIKSEVAPGTTGTADAANATAAQLIKKDKTVTMQAGNNLVVKQTNDTTNGNASVEFSLAKDLTNLKSIDLKGTPGTNGQTGQDGVSITGPGGKDGNDGLDGKVGISGKDGKDAVSISGKDGVGTIGLNGKDGKSADITVAKGDPGVNGAPGTNLTRIVYTDPTNPTNPPIQVATLEDGMKYAGDNGQDPADAGNVLKKKLNTTVDILGGADKTKLSDNNIGVNSDNGKLYVKLSKELKDLTSAEFKNAAGDKTELGPNGITITPAGKTPVSLTKDGLNNGGNKITNVAPGTDPTDAVNVSQLNNLIGDYGWNIKSEAATGTSGTADAANATAAQAIKKDKTVTMQAGNNLVVKQTNDTTNGNASVEFSLAKDLTDLKSIELKGKDATGATGKDGVSITGPGGKDGNDGLDGKVGISGKDGKDAVSISGKDGEGAIGLNGKDGSNAEIKVEKAKPTLDNQDPTNGKNDRIVYKDSTGTKQEIATMNDGLIFTGNNVTVLNKHKLNTTVKIVGERNDNKTTYTTAESAKNNIMVEADGTDTLTVKLAKILKDLESAEFKNPAGDTTNIGGNGITITPVAPAPGAPAKDPVSLTKDGLNNGGNQVKNVDSGLKDATGNPIALKDAAGDTLKNAVNVGDLKDAITSTQAATTWKVSAKANGGTATGTDANASDISNQQVDFVAGKNLNVKKVEDKATGNVDVTYELAKDLNVESIKVGKDGANGQPGKDGVTIQGPDAQNGTDGKIGISGKDGKDAVSISGKDGVGTIGLNGADGKSADIQVANGKDGVDGTNPGGKTRIVYTPKDANGNPITDKDGNPIKEEVATLNDGMKYYGDAITGTEIIKKKLNEQVNVVGGITDRAKLAEVANLGVISDGENNLTIRLAKDLTGLTSADFTNLGNPAVPNAAAPSSTKVDGNGITITPTNQPGTPAKDPVSLTDKGLDNGGNQVKNVDSGLKKADGIPAKLEDIAANDPMLKNGVNVGDLQKATNDVKAATTWKVFAKAGEGTATGTDANASDISNQQVDFVAGKNLNVKKIATANGNVDITYDLAKELTDLEGIKVAGKDPVNGKDAVSISGKDGNGAVAVNGKDGSGVGLNGKDGTISLTTAPGAPGANGEPGKPGSSIDFGTQKGTATLNNPSEPNNTNGKDDRIVYTPKDANGNPINGKDGKPIVREVATMDDGLIFTGNNEATKLNTHKLNTTVKIVGDRDDSKTTYSDAESAKNNIVVEADGTDKLTVKLAKNLTNLTSIDLKGTPGTNGQAGKDGVSITGPGGKNGNDGLDGKVGISGKDGKDAVSISGKDGVGTIGLNGKDGKSADIQVANGKDGLDGANPTGKTRIVYEPKDKDGNPIKDKNGNPVREEVATLNDGLKFKGDDSTVLAKPLNSQLDILGGADKSKLTDNNIGVNSNKDGQLEVKLAKDLKGVSSISNGGTTVEIGGNNGGVNITGGNLDMGGNKITNVAAGTDDRDAVNVSQLNEVKQVMNQQGDILNQYGDAINDNAQKIADLEDSSSRGIAGAMAQAGVKFHEIGINQAVVGAAISNYKGRSAVAAGIQVAPTENVRVHGIASAAPGRSKSANFGVTVGASYRFNLK